MCLRFLEPLSSYLKIRNDWYTRNRTKIVFILYIKSTLNHHPLKFAISLQNLVLFIMVFPGDLFSAPSSSQYTFSLYMILLVNFQMYTITFTLMIFNYIPSYPIPPMYYQITHNYVNKHQLSDHGFYLTIFYSTLQNLHS